MSREEKKVEGRTRNGPPSLLLGRYYQWPGSSDGDLGCEAQTRKWMKPRSLWFAPWHLPASRGASAWHARPYQSVIIMELVCGCVGRGVVTPWNRILGFILLTTLSACGETKDLCSTVTYQITAKLTVSHSKHTKDETPHHRERKRRKMNRREYGGMASKDLWQGHKEQQCGDIKKEQERFGCAGPVGGVTTASLGLFYISTMQKLAETRSRADEGFYRNACSVPA